MKFNVGDTVRSSKNPDMTYKVIKVNIKTLTVISIFEGLEGIIFISPKKIFTVIEG